MPHEPGHHDHAGAGEEIHAAGYVDPRGVTAGCEVYTSDGDRIGTVKEVRPGYFKVDVRLQPDYWLQSEFVRSCADGRITMEFGKDDLGGYKVKELPDHLADWRPVDEQPATPEGGPGENIAAATIREAEQGNRET